MGEGFVASGRALTARPVPEGTRSRPARRPPQASRSAARMRPSLPTGTFDQYAAIIAGDDAADHRPTAPELDDLDRVLNIFLQTRKVRGELSHIIGPERPVQNPTDDQRHFLEAPLNLFPEPLHTPGIFRV